MRRVVVVAVATVLLGAAGCPRASVPVSSVAVRLRGKGAGAGVAVVEEAVKGVKGVKGVRSVACADEAAVVVEGDDDAFDAVAAAVRAQQARLPPRVVPAIERQKPELLVVTVRAADPFAARAAADAVVVPAVRAVTGVAAVEVAGGEKKRQVQLDLARLAQNDLGVLEVLSVVGGPSSLETAVVRTSHPQPPALEKRLPAPPAPGEVRLLLRDVAEVGLLPTGEALRRDGAVEVRVFGDAAAAGAARDALQALALPQQTEVAVLDDDSVEDVAVVAGAGVDVDGLQRALLAIPGVRLRDVDTVLVATVDDARARALGVDPADVAAVVDVARGGRLVLRNTENVVVTLAGATTPELLGAVPVKKAIAGGMVRLSDVAVLSAVPRLVDRVDGRPAQRLRVFFDVGVRKNALAKVEEVAARFSASSSSGSGAGRVVVERRAAACR